MTSVLIVEDSVDDLFLLKRIFGKLRLEHQIQSVQDGNAAIRYLEDPTKPRPKLMLLDLQLPKLSGFEVLSWVRGHSELRNLPVVILTSSSEPQDLRRAYALGANGYLVKHGALEQLQTMMQASSDFWLESNQIPAWA